VLFKAHKISIISVWHDCKLAATLTSCQKDQGK